jgi:DNA-binding transcriptional LysR family regulator
VVELGKLFDGLELKLLRGTASEVLEYLKQGEVELGIAAKISDEWERLDNWPLFTEDFQLIVNSMHAFAARPRIALDDLKRERLMVRTYCETTDELLNLLRGREFDVTRFHEVNADSDLISLLEAGLGVALLPRSTRNPATLVRIVVDGIELTRTVNLYGVAGRQRTPVASAMMKMLRAYDWSRLTV